MAKTEMRPIKETIPLEEARAIIDEAVRPIERRERVAILNANGRVNASDVLSTRDVPPFSRAGMDGFAVIANDTFGANRYEPKSLRVIEKVYTGQVPSKAVSQGTATEIATGAPMPAGADAVVMVEETERDPSTGSGQSGDTVRILTPVYPRQNVGKQGADIVTGQTVLRDGEVLNPSRIGALAALGVGDVEVYEKPTVAILSTGNEIVDPGVELKPGQIYDINKFTLSTIIAEHGGVARPFATAQDTIEALEHAIDACLSCDMLVFSGGSSVGERDLILDVLKRKGEVLFHGIAVKPGKPTVFGVVGGKPVFGMPGYPTSCLSNACRHQFYTVRIVDGQAMPAFKASGDITSMSQADGYIEIPAQTDIAEKGQVVEVKLF
jgi:molybdopterin molybdotransferase